jgi:hypothetical protein
MKVFSGYVGDGLTSVVDWVHGTSTGAIEKPAFLSETKMRHIARFCVRNLGWAAGIHASGATLSPAHT